MAVKHMSRSPIRGGRFFYAVTGEGERRLRHGIVWAAVCAIAGMATASAGGMAAIAAALAGTAALWLLMTKGSVPRTLLFTLVFACCAGWYEFTDTVNVSPVTLGEAEEAEAIIEGVVVSPPELDGDRAVFDVARASVQVAGQSMVRTNRTERLKVYVRFETPEELAEAAAWRRGDLAALRGTLRAPLAATNFDGFNYRSYIRRHYVHWTLHVKGGEHAMLQRSSGGWSVPGMLSKVDLVRSALAAKLDDLYAEPYAGLMQGLVIGLRDGLDPEVYREFSQIGLSHILAISGLHVGLFVGSALWGLGKLPLTRERRLTAAMALVPFYIVITGASPSVVRAGAMAIIALFLAKKRKLRDGLHVLAFVALLMLAWHPYYLHDVSFQLSFAVTAGLIIGVPKISRLLPIRNRMLNASAAVTITAQLVSFPLTIYYFNGFSLLSFPANFALVPVFSLLVLPLGSTSLLLSFLVPAAGRAFAWAATQLSALSFRTMELLNGLDGAYTIWASPPLWWIAAYYAAGFGLLHGLSTRRAMHAVEEGTTTAPPPPIASDYTFAAAPLVVCSFVLGGLLLYAYMPDAGDNRGTVSFLDVGQGDSILIRTPEGKRLLIDGGGTLSFMKKGDEWRLRQDPYEVGEDMLVPLLKRRGVQRLDAVFVTHADTDHLGGLQAVVESIPVARVVFNGTVKPTAGAERWFSAVLQRGIPMYAAREGDEWRIDAHTTIRVLYPERSEGGNVRFDMEQNEASLVFLLTMLDRSFLFTGDIGSSEEERILSMEKAAATVVWPKIDVLKIAHHGSKTSSSRNWLAFWNPAAAVISVGRGNHYGHPHPTVTESLDRLGIPTLRTDSHGEIQFEIREGHWRVRTKLRQE